MGDAAQARFDAAQNNRHFRESLTAALRIHHSRAIRALARLGIGSVGIVRTRFAVGRIAINHRIHIASGNAPKEIGLTELLEIFGRFPVRLANHADAKALRFEHAADHGHPETWMIDIGIAGNQNHIAAIPAQLIHLGASHGQKWRGTEARGPVFAVAEDVFGGKHGRTRKQQGADYSASPNPCFQNKNPAQCRVLGLRFSVRDAEKPRVGYR